MTILQSAWAAGQSLWTLQSHAAMATGELSWSLTQRTPHDAGSVLDVTFRIKNTTSVQKRYRIYFGLFDLSGPVIGTWVWPDDFVIPAMSEESFILSPRIDYSDCILQGSLYDPETGSMGATLQTVLEQSDVPIEGGLGNLSWNLLQKTSFAAGSNLNITFKIRNPSTSERRYQIYFGLYGLDGAVITTWSLPEEIVVAAGGERQLPLSVRIGHSNCTLQASLHNVDTCGMSSALQTTLEPPPGVGEQIAPIIGFASGVLVLGMISGMVANLGRYK